MLCSIIILIFLILYVYVDIVDYLYHEKIQNIRNESMDKFLPRLSYKDGKVKIINEDLNEDINI